MVLRATSAGAEMLAEERQDVILKTVRYRAGMGAMIDLEGVGDSVCIENLVQLARASPQTVLIAHIDGNSLILPQITNVLVDERQGRVRRPFGDYILLDNAILHRQIEILRRVLRIWRPCGG